MLEESLLRTVIGGTSQAGQVNQNWHFLGLVEKLRLLEGLGRKVEVEVHFTVCDFGGMREFEELAAKGGDGCFCCY